MLKYQIYQSKLEGSTAYGKFYARVVTDETIGLSELADHMKAHNSPYSMGTIYGILEDSVKCIRELLLQGKRVQLDNLASFGLSVVHSKGAETPDDFSIRSNVKNVKLTAQGIGEFSKSVLTGAASLKESTTYVSPRNPATEGITPEEGSGTGNDPNADIGGESGGGTESDVPAAE